VRNVLPQSTLCLLGSVQSVIAVSAAAATGTMNVHLSTRSDQPFTQRDVSLHCCGHVLVTN
jgi:hypothetical protein